jgi:translation initiation factor 1 (eIF-1/SUI1)
MARKAKRGPDPAAARPPEFKVNPFADLRVAAAVPPKPPPVPAKPKPSPAKPTAAMDPEDLALLEAFKDAGSIEFHGRPKGLRLETLKRSGGRPVTHVHGLPELSMLEQMQLTGDVRVSFGLGARFHERVLEVDGDQRDRLAPWLQARGYTVAPPE